MPQETRVPTRYRSKPQEVEAVQWRGGNYDEVARFTSASRLRGNGTVELRAGANGAQGWVPVPVGHWIVRSPDDLTDHWPVDPDYFAAKYDPVEEIPVPHQGGDDR